MTDKNVDESWKKKIEDEKDKAPEENPEAEPASFLGLINSLGVQAMMHLGLIEDPVSKKAYVSPEQAQYIIDVLGILEEKTKGNLTPEEDETIKGMLGELRGAFMKVMEMVRAQIQKGPDKPPSIIT